MSRARVPTYVYTVQGEAEQPCALYSDCTEFDTSSQSTTTPIFRPQRVRDNYFQLREKPQNRTWVGGGYFKGIRSYDTAFKRPLYPRRFGKTVFNYWHPSRGWHYCHYTSRVLQTVHIVIATNRS